MTKTKQNTKYLLAFLVLFASCFKLKNLPSQSLFVSYFNFVCQSSSKYNIPCNTITTVPVTYRGCLAGVKRGIGGRETGIEGD